MPINARSKGCRIERAAAKFLTSLGFPSERAARNGKSADDLVTPFDRLHIEVKGDRAVGLGTKALADAWLQANEQSGEREPVVLWWEHRKGWRVSFNCDGVLVTVGTDNEIKHILPVLAEKV